MPDNSKLTFEDISKLLRDTISTIKRGENLVEKISMAGVKAPSAWADMVDPILRFRDQLYADLAALEEAWARSQKKP